VSEVRRAVPLSVRDDLAELEPYVSPQQEARYRMNTNESPYEPPDAVMEEVGAELRSARFNRYPDKDAAALLDALAADLGRPKESLWLANGSNEVFLHLFLGFGGPGRTSLTFEPTYSLHTLIPKITGTRTLSQPRDGNFAIDLDRAVDRLRLERPDVVIACSPNNPTGNQEPLTTIEALLEEAPGLVVVDEAYIEFGSPEGSALSLLDEHPNLVVTRTFSKAWRLAGVRLGYMLAHPNLIADLARVRLPYHLSSISQAFGIAALRNRDAMLEAVGALAEERDRMAVELQAMGIMSHPSQANFVLFEVDDPQDTWAGLLERGVLVRNYSGVPGLERCLRVTAGLPEETDAFLSAMGEVVGD
jgi:histidinol-phosphate aminotransferase